MGKSRSYHAPSPLHSLFLRNFKWEIHLEQSRIKLSNSTLNVFSYSLLPLPLTLTTSCTTLHAKLYPAPKGPCSNFPSRYMLSTQISVHHGFQGVELR